MDIVVIGSTQLRNEEKKRRIVRVPGRSRPIMDRRRNRVDRRQSVRDGVTVSISHQNDRRRQPDRRRTPST
jgi:hypothetical protein